MPNPVIIQGEVWEQTNPTILARVTDENGVVFVNTDVGAAGWDLRIYDLTASSPDTACTREPRMPMQAPCGSMRNTRPQGTSVT